jgi:hypothetical protein
MTEILIMLWVVTGCAGVLHMHYVVRRELHRIYGNKYPMDAPLLDHMSIPLFVIFSGFGPICFVATFLAFSRSFFK